MRPGARIAVILMVGAGCSTSPTSLDANLIHLRDGSPCGDPPGPIWDDRCNMARCGDPVCAPFCDRPAYSCEITGWQAHQLDCWLTCR